jgi:branched-chain amino acid transport system substrate-binding protein
MLVQTGGRAVEGIIFSVPYDTTRQTPAYLDFRRRYSERFGREPGFAAAMAYESAYVLAAALQATEGSAVGLAEALRASLDVAVLDDVIALDANGDVVRPVALVAVRDGAFVPVGAVSLHTP